MKRIRFHLREEFLGLANFRRVWIAQVTDCSDQVYGSQAPCTDPDPLGPGPAHHSDSLANNTFIIPNPGLGMPWVVFRKTSRRAAEATIPAAIRIEECAWVAVTANVLVGQTPDAPDFRASMGVSQHPSPGDLGFGPGHPVRHR